MQFISDDICRSFRVSSIDALKWVEETIKTKKKMILPPKISIRLDGGRFYNTMPCVIPSLNIAGIKEVNRYPGNNPALNAHIMMYDLSSGQLKAIMEASYITSLRSAAVGIHSVHLFAKSDYRTIAFIGLGAVGSLALKIYVETINNKEVTIRLFNYKGRGKQFIELYSQYKNIVWELYESFDEMVSDCDIIVSAVTYMDVDFTTPDKYKKGCLLVPIHTRGFTKCDLEFDKIYGDDTGHIQGFKYFKEFKFFEEICDVVNGIVPGRENDEERIIAYSVGVAIQDLVFAHHFLNLLEEGAPV